LQFALNVDAVADTDADAAAHRSALPRHKVARWIRHALACDAQITVRIVGEAEGRALNRDYRKKDYATNVLTFGYDGTPLCADLVLCAPVIQREAAAQRKSLHAQGWDHETSAADARRMEAHETEILAGLGFVDPYR
jgi:probable rRNA maturation factor